MIFRSRNWKKLMDKSTILTHYVSGDCGRDIYGDGYFSLYFPNKNLAKLVAKVMTKLGFSANYGELEYPVFKINGRFRHQSDLSLCKEHGITRKYIGRHPFEARNAYLCSECSMPVESMEDMSPKEVLKHVKRTEKAAAKAGFGEVRDAA